MFERIRRLLLENGIELSAPIALADCTLSRPYLLDRVGIDDKGTAVIFAIPYHTPSCESPQRNCSRYAVGRDYHLFVKQLSHTILPVLKEEYPTFRFAMFADHSPIDEREAAARAGLGLLGKNKLLITEKYASYVFLAELVTNAPPPDTRTLTEPRSCDNCGACIAACPMLLGKASECLSAVTQRKGSLFDNEQRLLVEFDTVWGCDLCQEVCPYTKEAIKNGTVTSPIPFFHTDPLPRLTYERIQGMTDQQFSERAYAWRGREVILRNLIVTERENAETASREKEEEAGE